jgi:plastocyanin
MRGKVAIVAVISAGVVGSLSTGVASAATETVYADAPPSAQKLLMHYGASINNFLPGTVTIHRGDTVKFLNEGFHTIDLPRKGGSDLAFLVPSGTATGSNDAAGGPFWFNGRPKLGFNPGLLAPSGPKAYDGSTRIDSGAPSGGPVKPFNVTFTKTGTYKYFCDVHPGMVGYVVVKAKSKKVPTPAQDAAAAATQLKADEASAKKLATTKVAANHVSLGVSDAQGVEDYAMFPATLRVKAGTVVTFSMSPNSREDHSATFGPAAELTTLANSFMGPAPAPQAVYPSSPGQPIPLGATSHGDGFANTGLLDEDKATRSIPSSGRIRFTQAGTYHFICVIHAFMTGTVVVN